MKKMTLLIFVFFEVIHVYGQNDTLVKKQRGILFLSSYNYKYDPTEGHMRLLGFEDYFFPTTLFCSKLFLDSNVSLAFKNGLRVDSIQGRNVLKTKAKYFECFDTSNCYQYKGFYILPVEVTYQLFADDWPLYCKKDFFELNLHKGNYVRFSFNRMRILVLKSRILVE